MLWVRGQKAEGRRRYRRVKVVYFLLQVSIVLPYTHHMTPGHSLLIRVALDPPVPPSLRHTHTITHSGTNNGFLVIPDECTGSLPSRFELNAEGPNHHAGMDCKEAPADPKSSSIQVIDTAFISPKQLSTAYFTQCVSVVNTKAV